MGVCFYVSASLSCSITKQAGAELCQAQQALARYPSATHKGLDNELVFSYATSLVNWIKASEIRFVEVVYFFVQN